MRGLVRLNDAPQLIDATAGLGHDSLLIAALGAQVQLIERHPILYTLLEDALARAQLDPYLAPIAARMRLIYSDAAGYLTQLSQAHSQAASLSQLQSQPTTTTTNTAAGRCGVFRPNVSAARPTWQRR